MLKSSPAVSFHQQYGFIMCGSYAWYKKVKSAHWIWLVSIQTQHLKRWLMCLGIIVWADVWSHIEACASIFTACLPTIAPLFTDSKGLRWIITSVRSLPSRWNSTSLCWNSDRREEDSKHTASKKLPASTNGTNRKHARIFFPTVVDHKTDEEALVDSVDTS